MTENEYNENLENRKAIFIEKATSKEAMENLFKAINKKCGTDFNFKYEIQTDGSSKPYIKFESEDFAKTDKLISLAWSEMRISNFSGGLWIERNRASYYGSSEEDFSKPCPNIGYSCEVNFAYRHIDGGTNGATIGYATISEKTNFEWEFKTVSERKAEYERR